MNLKKINKQLKKDGLKTLKETATQVQRWVGKDDFLIYGGLISDLLSGTYNQNCDIDIAFKYESETQIMSVIKSLLENQFSIIADRDYYIRDTHYVRLLYAVKEAMVLDIAFMNDPYEVGVLTMDSIFYSNRLAKLVDNYGGIKDFREGCIRLRKGARTENPLYILNRLICVCAKYDISLKSEGISRIIEESSWEYEESIMENKDATSSYLSRLIKSIVVAKNQECFIRELIDEGIICKVFPVLQTVLERLLNNGKYREASSKQEFIVNTYCGVKNDFELEELEKYFSYFRYRTWNEEEFRLAHICPDNIYFEEKRL